MSNNRSATAYVMITDGADTCGMTTPTRTVEHRMQAQHQQTNISGGSTTENHCSGSAACPVTFHQNQTAPWALMGILPQQNATQAHSSLSSRSSFFGESSNAVPVRYGDCEETNCKEPQINSALYQFQDLDMIASIVAKEQAMLKMNSAAGRADSSRLGGISLPHHHHTQVIVNGARENLSSSPSEMSPTSCSPSSSDPVNTARRANMQQQNDGGGGAAIRRHNSGNDSPVDVTGLISNQTLKQEPHFDMTGILGMSQSNGHLPATGLSAITAADHLLPSSTSLGSFAGISYHPQQSQQHSNGSSASTHSQLQSPAEAGASTTAPTMVRARHRSSQHDGLIKCHYCPKKWADQAVLRVHMEECRVLRMHECQQCGKRFKARGGLQQHMRIHSNDRPYQCHYCPKRFTQKSHVDQHERIHTGAKPFSCQYCGRAFRQRSQQMGHEATHANGPISIAANIASQQQQQLHLSTESPLNSASEEHSPAATDGSSATGQRTHTQQQRISNNSSAGNGNEQHIMHPNGNGMVAHNAVSSLLALSQGGGMSVQQPQTLSEALAARGV